MNPRLSLLVFLAVALPSLAVAADPPAQSDKAPAPATRVATVLVSGIDGEPVAGCVVEARRDGDMDLFLDDEQVLVLTTPDAVAATDKEGKAHFELTTGYWSLQVQHKDGVGFGGAWGPPEPGATGPTPSPDVFHVGLNRVRRINVVAQGEDAQPLAGVIVTLVDPDDGALAPSLLMETNQSELLWGVSDDQGRVVFVLDRDSRYGIGSAKRLQATALRYGGEAIHTVQDVGEGDATIPLELPPTVALRLRLPQGAPGESVRVLWARGDSFPRQSYSRIHWQSGTTFLDVFGVVTATWSLSLPSAGRELRTFAPSTQVTFVTRASGREEASHTITLTDAFEQELTLPLGPRLAQLRLQIVDEHGDRRRIDGLGFAVQANGDQRPVHVRDASASSDDNETHTHSASLPAGPAGQLVVMPNERRLRRSGTPSPLAKVAIPALASGASVDAKLVIPQLDPLIVAGRVLDRSGKPVAGAYVSVSGEEVESQKTRLPWAERYRSTTSRPDGSFKIYLPHRKELRYKVEVKSNLRSQPVAFEPGALGVIVVAELPGTIEGRVRSALTDLRQRIRIRLLQDGEQVHETSLHRPDGTFELRRLLAGTYSVQIELVGRKVHEVGDIQVRAGETARPKELANLIVGHDFYIGEVSVRDDEGKPIVGCAVQVERNDAVSAWGFLETQSATDADGVARLILRRGFPSKITVLPFYSDLLLDFRSQTFEDPDFPLDVVLERRGPGDW